MKTATDYAKMSNEEIDREIAVKVMGWMLDSEGFWTKDGLSVWNPSRWHPATDHNDAALVKAEIERRGLMSDFIDHLDDVCGHSLSYSETIMATPRQQCEAALLAIQESAS